MALKEGVKAPNFKLSDQNGIIHNLSDYSGKKIILYFYPKDDTPGCTKEACSFRDNYSSFSSAGFEILGISPDNEKSHMKFQEKFQLPFVLLSDQDHKISDLYDVWGPKKFMGNEYEGISRTTYIIDEKGVIIKTFENVKPAEHAEEILTIMKTLE